eukprot:4416630-Prorocentrum_lima.AAC.1
MALYPPSADAGPPPATYQRAQKAIALIRALREVVKLAQPTGGKHPATAIMRSLALRAMDYDGA